MATPEGQACQVKSEKTSGHFSAQVFGFQWFFRGVTLDRAPSAKAPKQCVLSECLIATQARKHACALAAIPVLWFKQWTVLTERV
jgi:hypothetical protein